MTRRSHRFTPGLLVNPLPTDRSGVHCRSVETTPSYVLGLQYHVCQLQRYHFGPHQCWCEWTFGQPESQPFQLYLPFLQGEDQ